jgi:hypothetical protein
MEAVPFGHFYKTSATEGYSLTENFYLFAEGVKKLSAGHKFH